MPDDVVQLHVDAMNDMLATRAASGPTGAPPPPPPPSVAAAPAIGAPEQAWASWASLTGHKRYKRYKRYKRGSAEWIAVRADAAARTPAAIARRRQNDEEEATRLKEDAEIKRRRRVEADAVEKESRVQFERLERSRHQQERDDMQQLDRYWSKLFRIDPEEEIRWLAKRANELSPSKRQRLMQILGSSW